MKLWKALVTKSLDFWKVSKDTFNALCKAAQFTFYYPRDICFLFGNSMASFFHQTIIVVVQGLIIVPLD